MTLFRNSHWVVISLDYCCAIVIFSYLSTIVLRYVKGGVNEG